MEIRELYLKNFGKFSDQRFTFEPGLNLICGENESGKTTLHAFIRSGFYGLKRTRGRGAGKDVFSRYEPWDNPGYYAGNIRFQCADKLFRLERDFKNPGKDGKLICETDGERMSVEDGDLEMLLGGIGEVVFENTVYVRQLQSQTEDGLAGELKNYIANYQDGDSSVDVQESLYLLKNRKKEMEKQLQEKRKVQEAQKEKLFSRIPYVQEEIRKNKEEWKTLDVRCRELEEKRKKEMDRRNAQDPGRETDRRNEEDSGEEKNRSIRKRFGDALILAALGVLIFWLRFRVGGSLPAFLNTMFTVTAAVMLLMSAGMFGTVWQRRNREEKSGRDQGSPESEYGDGPGNDSGSECGEQPGNLPENNPEYLRWSMDRLEKEVHEKELQIENLQDEIHAVADGDDKNVRKNLEAIALAVSYIEETVADLRVYVGKQLKRRTSEILAELTDGKYTMVELNENFQPGVHSEDRYIPLEQLSRGTMEQVYFSLRMAAGEILCQEEQMPVILDDVFAMYDEERLSRVLGWLSRQNRQILIFTCHRREEELLKKSGIPYHKVYL